MDCLFRLRPYYTTLYYTIPYHNYWHTILYYATQHYRWTASSVFVVTVVDALGHDWAASRGGVVSVTGDVKNYNQLSRWCRASAPLGGTAGSLSAPQVVRYDAQTWGIQDPGWSRYDTLTIAFDLPTDLGGREGGKAYVDTVLLHTL